MAMSKEDITTLTMYHIKLDTLCKIAMSELVMK